MYVFYMYLVCIWRVFSEYLICIWYSFGMYDLLSCEEHIEVENESHNLGQLPHVHPFESTHTNTPESKHAHTQNTQFHTTSFQR